MSKSKQTSKANPSSIKFGPVNYDEREHLLKVDALRGKNTIQCLIDENALFECYHAGPSKQELTKTFQQHEKDFMQAVERKIQSKQWQVPNQQIMLDSQDLQRKR